MTTESRRFLAAVAVEALRDAEAAKVDAAATPEEAAEIRRTYAQERDRLLVTLYREPVADD